MGTTVALCEYSSAWPDQFNRARDAIQVAVQVENTVIEHIGSTAIPGLAAKPVVDIMLGLPSLDDPVGPIQEPLGNIGYLWMEAYLERLPNRLFFYRENSDGQRTEHLHVVVYEGPEWKRHLLFRDYLRAHPDVAGEYERLKRDLAPKFADTTRYSDAKTPWIRAIERRALLEMTDAI
jgi:GrpB-like predicted nucleotidyltransferase (UPF0157 family)